MLYIHQEQHYIHSMISPRSQMVALIEKEVISAENIEQALFVSEVAPKGIAWHRFIDKLLLWLGVLAVAFAVLFFIAYNWSDLGRFAKFGLLEVLLILTIAAYWRWGDNTQSGKAALLVATIFLGVLLALYGQTYQTGADTWQLFFNWALLMIPWLMMSRFSVIWMLWIVLLNLSVVLYFQASVNVLWLMLTSDSSVLWSLFAMNTLALILWEAQQKQRLWMQNAWLVRLLGLGSGISITWLVLNAIFQNGYSDFIMHGLAWCVWLGALYFFYRKLQPNLFMLAGGCLSGIVVIMVFISNQILHRNDMSGFLFIALLIMALGAGAAKWLKNIHQELQV